MAFNGFLAPAVHALSLDGDIVFLDIRADAYVCLPRGAEALRLQPGGAVCADRELAAELLAMGLVAKQPGEARRAAPPPLPRRSALRDAYAPPSLRDLAEMAMAVADVLRLYAGRSFADLLAAAARPPGAPDPQITPALTAAVDRYHRWAPYATLPGKCLLRAFVLRRALRREGLDVLWVFGVRTWPFHAHCWLQVEDLVLDDHHDRVRAYTPLMAI